MDSGKSGLAARLGIIAAIGVAAVAVVMMVRSPLAIDEDVARRMVSSGELVGLPLEEAGSRLQHTVPGMEDGTVVLEFRQVKGWRAGPLTLDVRDGKVTAATWGEPEPEGY